MERVGWERLGGSLPKRDATGVAAALIQRSGRGASAVAPGSPRREEKRDGPSDAERCDLRGVASCRGIADGRRRKDDPELRAAARGCETERRRQIVEYAEPVGSDENDGLRSDGEQQLEVRRPVTEWREEPAGRFDDGDGRFVVSHPAVDGPCVDADAGLPCREMGRDRLGKGEKGRARRRVGCRADAPLVSSWGCFT